MALTKALQKRIAEANKYIKFAQKHDIFGRGYFGSTMESVFTYPHLITVSPTGRSVRVRYNDVYGKGKHSQSFNTNDPDSVSDLRYEITHYVIGAIKRGAKDEGRSIPKTLSNPTKRKNSRGKLKLGVELPTYRRSDWDEVFGERFRWLDSVKAFDPMILSGVDDVPYLQIEQARGATKEQFLRAMKRDFNRIVKDVAMAYAAKGVGRHPKQIVANISQGYGNRELIAELRKAYAKSNPRKRRNPHHPYPKKSFQIDRVSDLTKLAKETGGEFQLDPNSGYFSGGENIYFWDSHGRNWYFKADEFDSKARSRLASAIEGLTYTEYKHSRGRFHADARMARMLGLSDDTYRDIFRDNSKPRKRNKALTRKQKENAIAGKFPPDSKRGRGDKREIMLTGDSAKVLGVSNYTVVRMASDLTNEQIDTLYDFLVLRKRSNPRKRKTYEWTDDGKPGRYRIYEGFDHYNGKPLYRVVGVNNDYVGEWHTSKASAQRELKETLAYDARYANPRKRKNGSKSSHGFRYPKGKHMAKSWAQIMREYEKKEDRNDHSGNYLMIAEALGRPEKVLKELRSIKRARDRRGLDMTQVQRQHQLTKGDYARAMKYMKAEKSRKRKNPDALMCEYQWYTIRRGRGAKSWYLSPKYSIPGTRFASSQVEYDFPSQAEAKRQGKLYEKEIDRLPRRPNSGHKGEVNPYSKRYTYMDFTKKFWGKNWRDVPRDIRLSFWDDFKLAFVGGLQKYKEATRG